MKEVVLLLITTILIRYYDGACASSLNVAACDGLVRDAVGRWITGYARRIGIWEM